MDAFLYTGGEDFETTTQNITFLPGDSLHLVFVPIIDDQAYEGEHEFYGELTSISDGVVDIFEPSATVVISDNDGELDSHQH